MPTERSEGALVFRVDCHREVAGNGWDEPCKSRGLRTVLWATGGEIPPADPAVTNQAQGFLSAHSFIYGPFRPRRHRLTASVYRTARTEAFNIWRQENCARQAS